MWQIQPLSTQISHGFFIPTLYRTISRYQHYLIHHGYHSQTIRIGRPNMQLLIIFLFFQLKGIVLYAQVEKGLAESFHPENIVVVFGKLKMSSDNKFPTKNSLCTSLFGQITELRKSRFVTNTTAIIDKGAICRHLICFPFYFQTPVLNESTSTSCNSSQL